MSRIAIIDHSNANADQRVLLPQVALNGARMNRKLPCKRLRVELVVIGSRSGHCGHVKALLGLNYVIYCLK